MASQGVYMTPQQARRCFDCYCAGESFEVIAAKVGKMPDRIRQMATHRGWEKAREELIAKGAVKELDASAILTGEEFQEDTLRNYQMVREKLLGKAARGEEKSVAALVQLDRAEAEIREAGKQKTVINLVFPGMVIPTEEEIALARTQDTQTGPEPRGKVH